MTREEAKAALEETNYYSALLREVIQAFISSIDKAIAEDRKPPPGASGYFHEIDILPVETEA